MATTTSPSVSAGLALAAMLPCTIAKHTIAELPKHALWTLLGLFL
jgi:hypothetical protein